jgi:hypothetical protein
MNEDYQGFRITLRYEPGIDDDSRWMTYDKIGQKHWSPTCTEIVTQAEFPIHEKWFASQSAAIKYAKKNIDKELKRRSQENPLK